MVMWKPKLAKLGLIPYCFMGPNYGVSRSRLFKTSEGLLACSNLELFQGGTLVLSQYTFWGTFGVVLGRHFNVTSHLPLGQFSVVSREV
jgi:hypothetical protein